MSSRTDSYGMPLLRYFLVVGAALAGLLLISGAYLPKAPDEVAAVDSAADIPMIRIQSDRKLPQRVVFDTSASVNPRVADVAISTESTTKQATASEVPANEATVNSRPQDAMAQLTSAEPKVTTSTADIKNLDRNVPRKKRIARRHVTPPTVLASRQPQFGFFGNDIW